MFISYTDYSGKKSAKAKTPIHTEHAHPPSCRAHNVPLHPRTRFFFVGRKGRTTAHRLGEEVRVVERALDLLYHTALLVPLVAHVTQQGQATAMRIY